jgi:TetR/AcrR family transcriptional regulator
MAIRAARKRLSAQERELQILHAAARAFARSNFRLAGTAEIAAEAGIAEPTIYKYFSSKKELFIRILRRIGERILAQWKTAAAEEPDAIAALRRIGRSYLAAVQTHSDDLKLQFQALAESDDADIARQLRNNHSAYVEFLAKLVAQAKQEGTLRGDVDAYAAGWLLNGIGFTLTMSKLLDLKNQPGRGPERMVLGYLDWLASPGTGAVGPDRRPGRRTTGRTK